MSFLSTLAEFSRHVTGSTNWTWLTQPQKNFPCWYLLFSSFSCRLKYIPYSDGIRFVLPGFDKELELQLANTAWNSYLSDKKAQIVKPTDPDVARVLHVLVKIIQALSDGLRLKRDCKVYANHNVPFLNNNNNNNNNAVVVPSRCGNKETISRGRFDSPMSFLGMKYDTEHLDGLDWEVMMVQSPEENAFYYGNGKILLYDRMVFSSTPDEEIACYLAHEVGHGVGMHIEGSPHKALWFLHLIPWPKGFWSMAVFIRLCELVLCCLRRNEYEADHIGLMLMASAGYDPRLAPQFYKELLKCECLLDTTHPSCEKRVKMLSRDAVMGRAVKIYEQVQAGHEVPSFI